MLLTENRDIIIYQIYSNCYFYLKIIAYYKVIS